MGTLLSSEYISDIPTIQRLISGISGMTLPGSGWRWWFLRGSLHQHLGRDSCFPPTPDLEVVHTCSTLNEMMPSTGGPSVERPGDFCTAGVEMRSGHHLILWWGLVSGVHYSTVHGKSGLPSTSGTPMTSRISSTMSPSSSSVARNETEATDSSLREMTNASS